METSFGFSVPGKYTHEFKSYYVVWKLKDSEKYYEQDNEFKSYYVVWKPAKRTTKSGGGRSLNRTM